MKKLILTLTTLVAVALVGLTGCSKKPQLQTDAADFAFAAAEDAQRSALEKAIMAFQESDPAGALAGLEKLLGDAALTDEQKDAVKGLITQVKTALGQAGGAAAKAVEGAAKDATKAVEGAK
jgi:hypothetical protein